jgi:hypothetical protein
MFMLGMDLQRTSIHSGSEVAGAMATEMACPMVSRKLGGFHLEEAVEVEVEDQEEVGALVQGKLRLEGEVDPDRVHSFSHQPILLSIP